MSKVDIINCVVSQIRTRDDSNKYGDVNTATLAPLQTINNNNNYSNNYQLFSQFLSLIFITSLINHKEQQIKRVSMNLQVVSPHFAVSSFQMRNIANTARHIAYIANCNLSNFMVSFIFNYSYP